MRHDPVPAGGLSALEPGADLQDCLDVLGAPLWVWERPVEDGIGFAAAYGWFLSQDWGFDVSIPVTEWYSVSFDYGEISEDMQGVVLFFDAEGRLESFREGLLRDLTVGARRPRPALVEE